MIGTGGMVGKATRPRWAVVVALAIGAGGARSASAQVGVESLPLAAAYGTGVHAYFSGDYDRTLADLGSIIAAGSTDPRAHYFRGLALLRMGRMEEAEADFADGADLETGNLGQWPVSRSLERVQGADRLQLERHRVRARVVKIQRERDAIQARVDDAARAQSDVIRERRPAPTLPPGSVEPNPFAGGDGDEPPPAVPPVDREPPVDEPVDEPAAAPNAGPEESAPVTPPAEEPMEEDVPANPPAEPTPDPPAGAEESTELDAEMPPAAGAPGAEPGAEPAGDGGTPAAEAADPFGDGPAPDPASPPAEKQPEDAAGEEEPAAEDEPEMDAGDAEPAADGAAEDADEADADGTDSGETDANEEDDQEAKPIIEGE